MTTAIKHKKIKYYDNGKTSQPGSEKPQLLF